MQGLAAQWSSATKDRVKKAKEAFTGIQAKAAQAQLARTIKGRGPLVLDTASCIKVHRPPPPPPEPMALARGISDVFASLQFNTVEEHSLEGGGLGHAPKEFQDFALEA